LIVTDDEDDHRHRYMEDGCEQQPSSETDLSESFW
jgi:hypothetical protein